MEIYWYMPLKTTTFTLKSKMKYKHYLLEKAASLRLKLLAPKVFMIQYRFLQEAFLVLAKVLLDGLINLRFNRPEKSY